MNRRQWQAYHSEVVEALAVFLPWKKVEPLVTNCLDDDRPPVQMAVGWVLRETGGRYGSEFTAYLRGDAERRSTGRQA
jgi:3-methyladenine DNA glycosylase AlkD